MGIKQDIGRLHVSVNILSIIRQENIQILPLMAEEGLGIIDLPKIHNDQFDRILIVQARLYDLVFVTKDPNVMEYPAICVKA